MAGGDGYSYLVGALALAVLAFGLALRLRSWPLWLTAFGLTVGTLVVAWVVRASFVAAP